MSVKAASFPVKGMGDRTGYMMTNLTDILARQPRESHASTISSTDDCVPSASKTLPKTRAVAQHLSREEQMRQVLLLSFCEPLPEQCLQLRHLSSRRWQSLLRWLDISGLALYFFDRMTELKLTEILQADVIIRLQQNLADNTDRMRCMIEESIAIHEEFECRGFSYAILKGISFWPTSVPKPELRSQLDVDFLIAERDVPAARAILERRGYRLRAISGRSWEFKTDHLPSGSLKDLYKNVPLRSVELHAASDERSGLLLLASAERRVFYGATMPVLSPVDLFLGQGIHTFKHICSEFSRTAHLIEFRHHVLARHDDLLFWREVRRKAEQNPRASLALGVITLLISRIMGEFAPEALTCWTVQCLPPAVQLWVERYGWRAVLGGLPGSKLYLLLQRELEQKGVPAKRSLRQALLPLRLPPAIAHASANETIRSRMHRYRIQMRFVLFRVRFHVVEGLRYGWESLRWRRIRESVR